MKPLSLRTQARLIGAGVWALTGLVYAYVILATVVAYPVRAALAGVLAAYVVHRGQSIKVRHALLDALLVLVIGSLGLILVSVLLPSPVGASAVVFITLMELLLLPAALPLGLFGAAFSARRSRRRLERQKAQPPPVPDLLQPTFSGATGGRQRR